MVQEINSERSAFWIKRKGIPSAFWSQVQGGTDHAYTSVGARRELLGIRQRRIGMRGPIPQTRTPTQAGGGQAAAKEVTRRHLDPISWVRDAGGFQLLALRYDRSASRNT
jgi:hypothetical protein